MSGIQGLSANPGLLGRFCAAGGDLSGFTFDERRIFADMSCLWHDAFLHCGRAVLPAATINAELDWSDFWWTDIPYIILESTTTIPHNNVGQRMGVRLRLEATGRVPRLELVGEVYVRGPNAVAGAFGNQYLNNLCGVPVRQPRDPRVQVIQNVQHAAPGNCVQWHSFARVTGDLSNWGVQALPGSFTDLAVDAFDLTVEEALRIGLAF